MKPKPMGLRSKSIAAASLAVLGFAGLAIVQTTPAFADPTVQFVAVGSDTTENVMDQFAVDAGGNELGSYDAVNPVSQAIGETITPVKTSGTTAGNPCSFTRPDGSGQGLAALGASLGLTSTGTATGTAPGKGCIDIGRSSSADGDESSTGQLVFIPFAIDAVTDAVGPATGGTYTNPSGGTVTAVATSIKEASDFTAADLATLYDSCAPVTEGGVTYFPFETGVTIPSGDQRIDLYIPQTGSGTSKFWASKTGGWSLTNLPACVNTTIINGADNGTTVEENDGTAVSTDTDGIMPFSIAQWLSQPNHNDDRRYGAALQSIGGSSPFANSNDNSLNTSFPFTREVFNIVDLAEVTSTSSTFNAELAALFVGQSSALCSDVLTIKSYGFGILPTTATSTFDTCGDISDPATIGYPN